ncbi:facilitated trehalose transporter Tret1-like [Schistocerca gregaria]|uniref:facilitated trehalose transporter Tret1-like n=1 Tax=Schistocerca gregaria TaxID=7010 RepID=UPI00211E00A9|nr:facilitated trehalose transporter Tret1-like [Schistocerca gregaria]
MDVSSLSLHDPRQYVPDLVRLEDETLENEHQELKTLNNVYSSTTSEIDKTSAVPQILATAAVTGFHVVCGVSLGFSAIFIASVMKEGSDLKLSSTQSAWTASVLVLVVPIGALLGGILMEAYGRLNAIKMAAIPCAAGWILVAVGQSFLPIFIGRVLTGISGGMGTSPAVVYTTEIGRPEIRGALTASGPSLASLGMLIIYGEGAILDWRLCAWLNLIYTFAPIIVMAIWIPESPVWLVTKGRIDEAEKALKWLGGNNKTSHKKQLAAMVRSQDMRALTAPNFFQGLKVFLKPTAYKPIAIMSVLFIFQQFSGIYMTLFYAINFFEEVGTELDPNLATVFLGLMRFGMSIVSTILMKHFGRRKLVITSSLSMAACMTASGLSTMHIKNGGGGTWIPVACILGYVCASMIGLLGIPWTMTAELFPTQIRGLAHGILMSFAHIVMFVTIQYYFDMLNFFGGAHVLQWFFAVVCIMAAVHVWIFLPETHGVTLSDIEKYFRENTFYFMYSRKQARETKVTNS